MPHAPAASAAKQSASRLALREKLAATRQAVDHELVAAPALGDGVTIDVRSMMHGERATLLRDGFHDTDGERPIHDTFQPLVLIFTCHDPQSGERLFEHTEEDLAFVRALPPQVVDELSRVGCRVSGLSKEAAESRKNGSASTATDSPSSPSPARSAE